VLQLLRKNDCVVSAVLPVEIRSASSALIFVSAGIRQTTAAAALGMAIRQIES